MPCARLPRGCGGRRHRHDAGPGLACSDRAAARRAVAIFDTTGDAAQECLAKAPATREVFEWTVAAVADTGQPVVSDRRRAICLVPKAWVRVHPAGLRDLF